MNPPAPTGKSWPLFVLAGLAFIPVFGVLFGFIAACWGLLTDRPRGLLAAAVGGGGAILNIIVLMTVGVAMIQKNPRMGGIANSIARLELDSLEAHLDTYHTVHGRYPDALTQLPRPVGVGRVLPVIDHSIGLLNVTTLYQYRANGQGQGYELFGAGPDGVADTPDDVFPTSRLADDDDILPEPPGESVSTVDSSQP